jgi:hypothetical protein
MDWIHLSQDMDEWWGLMNILINLWVPYNVGIFLSNSPTVKIPKNDSAPPSWLVACTEETVGETSDGIYRGTGNFPLHCIQTGFGAHPVSHPVVIMKSFQSGQ